MGVPPSQAFLDELSRSEVAFKIGECVLEADALAVPKILDAARNLELSLTLVFNRVRVMVLPQGINKATGLREALNTLRLSLHNCIVIGDAENDFALLEACEIGVAVGWGRQVALRDSGRRATGIGTCGCRRLHPTGFRAYKATAKSDGLAAHTPRTNR